MPPALSPWSQSRGGLRHLPPRLGMWELRTLMALLSLSAKKAGVFLRHFTRREKQHNSICRKLSVERAQSTVSSSLRSQCSNPSRQPSPSPPSPPSSSIPGLGSSSLEQKHAEPGRQPNLLPGNQHGEKSCARKHRGSDVAQAGRGKLDTL